MISLLKIKLHQLQNGYRRGEKGKYFLFLLLGLFFILVLGFFFNKIFAYLYHLQEFPHVFKLFLAEKLLMMIFMTLFSMLLLSALLSSLDIFYLSRDLPFLITTPLPVRSIFVWKMLEVALTSSAMVVFFSMPVLFFYCRYFAPGFWQIWQILFVFMFYIASGVLAGILCGLIIPAFISVRRLQPLLSVFSIILISAIVVFLRLLRPERFLEPGEIDNVLKYMGSLDMKIFYYFPFSWLARALTLAAEGRLAAYWKSIALFSALCGGSLTLILWLEKKFYLILFDKLQKGGKGYYKSSWKRSRWQSDYLPVLKKELKTFLRTPAQWSQLLIVGALVAVFVINMKMIPLPHPQVKNFVAYLNIGMAVFIVAGLNSRFTFPAIPIEGMGLVHVFSAPFSKLKFYRFKVFFYLLPQMLVGFALFALGDLSMHFDGFTTVIAVVFMTPSIIFITVLAVVLGIQTNQLNPLSAQHVIVSKQGIMYMLLSMIYLVLGLLFMIRPVVIYYWHHYLKDSIPYGEIAAWFIAFEIINLALIVFYYRRGKRLWLRKEL